MSKLYVYKTVVRRTNQKKVKNEEKLIRQQMADLLEDQEPVMKGPPFNQVIDLTKLPHEKLIMRAQSVLTQWNPHGHPPANVSSPTMQSLIDGLEVTRESYAAIADPMRNESPLSDSSYNGSLLSDDKDSFEKQQGPTVFPPKATAAKAVKTTKALKVQFASLELTPVHKAKCSQHAIATLQDKSKAPRSVGARQVKVTERLGDYASGIKQIASSAAGLRSSGNISLASSSKPALTINLARQIDDNSSSGDSSVIVFSPNNNKGDENNTDFPLITNVKRGTNRSPS